MHRLPLRPADLVLADGAYPDASKCTVPSRRLARPTDENRQSRQSFFSGLAHPVDREYNRAHAFARGRVERAIRRLRNWKIFQVKWNIAATRGGIDFVNSAVKAAAHLHNFHCRWRLPEMPLCYVAPTHLLVRQADGKRFPWNDAAAKDSHVNAAKVLDAWTLRKQKPDVGVISAEFIKDLETIDLDACVHVATSAFVPKGRVWNGRNNPDAVFVEGALSDESSNSSARSVASDSSTSTNSGSDSDSDSDSGSGSGSGSGDDSGRRNRKRVASASAAPRKKAPTAPAKKTGSRKSQSVKTPRPQRC